MTNQDLTDETKMNDRKNTIDLVNLTLAKRHRAEKRFQFYGILSIAFGLMCLLLLFTNIIGKGVRGFTYHYLEIPIELDAETLGITDVNDFDQILAADYTSVVKRSVYDYFDVGTRREKSAVRKLIALEGTGYLLQDRFKTDADKLIIPLCGP